MRKVLLLVAIVAAIFSTAASAATSGVWHPGESYYISEDDANDLLDDTFDTAYCNGINRFGHRGEFPYQEFVVFDCTITYNDIYCSNWRYKAVKGSRRGYFKLRSIRDGHCF